MSSSSVETKSAEATSATKDDNSVTKLEVITGLGVLVDTESFNWAYFWEECEDKIIDKLSKFYKVDYHMAKDYHKKNNYRAFLIAMCKLAANDDLIVRGSNKLGDRHFFICHQRGAVKWIGKLDLVAASKVPVPTSVSTSSKATKSTDTTATETKQSKLLASSKTINKGERAGPVSLNYGDHEEVMDDFVRLNRVVDALIDDQKCTLQEEQLEGWKRDRLDDQFDAMPFGWKASWQMHSFAHSTK